MNDYAFVRRIKAAIESKVQSIGHADVQPLLTLAEESMDRSCARAAAALDNLRTSNNQYPTKAVVHLLETLEATGAAPEEPTAEEIEAAAMNKTSLGHQDPNGTALTELPLPARILEHLKAGGIDSVESLNDSVTAGDDLTAIKGIGQKATEMINSALEEYLDIEEEETSDDEDDGLEGLEEEEDEEDADHFDDEDEVVDDSEEPDDDD